MSTEPKKSKLGKAGAAARRKAFAAEIIKHNGNATQAAIALGYSKRTARSIASELLTHPDVQDEFQRLLTPFLNRERVDAERVLEELGRIGFSNMADYVEVADDGRSLTFRFPDPDAEDYLARMAAVEQITIEEYTEGTGEDAENVKRTRFKLGNKKGALDSLTKVLGMVVEKHEHTGRDGGPIRTEAADAVQAAIAGADETERGLLRQILEHRKRKADTERAEGI